MVKKRGEVYYLRLCVPEDIQGVIGCREVVRSLKTGVSREAKQRATDVNARAKRFWQQARAMKLTTEQLKNMVKVWLDAELAQYESVESAPLWLTSSKNVTELEFLLDELGNQRARLSLAYRAPDVKQIAAAGDIVIDGAIISGEHHDGSEFAACREIASQLLAEHGIADVDDENRLKLVRQVAGALLEVNKAQVKTACKVFNLPESALAAVQAPALPSANSAPLLSEVMAERLEFLRLNYKPATVKGVTSRMRFLAKLLGDKPVDQYTPADFLKVQGILKKWPRNANHICPEASVEEVLGRKDLGAPIGAPHVYLTEIKNLFGYAFKAGHISKDVTPHWKQPKATDKPPFSDEQLAKLFQSPHYTKRAVKVRRPENYWLYLIGLLSGMRIGEICQLAVDDVQCHGGIWCFSVNETAGAGEDEDKSVKTEAGHRLIPVHSKLIELGLLDHVEKMRKAGHRVLWPSLSKSIVKKVSDYILRHVTGDVKGARPTFHSLRKNFGTGLVLAGVDTTKSVLLMGHSPADKVFFTHYLKMPPDQRAALLKPAIERLDFPALAHLKP